MPGSFVCFLSSWLAWRGAACQEVGHEVKPCFPQRRCWVLLDWGLQPFECSSVVAGDSSVGAAIVVASMAASSNVPHSCLGPLTG